MSLRDMDSTQHAVTPWTARPWHSDDIEFSEPMLGTFHAICWEGEEFGGELAFTQGPQAAANAEFIVRAANSYSALLAELRRLEWAAHDLDDDTCPVCWGIHPDSDGSGHKPDCTLAAAIALATGQEVDRS